MTDVSPVTSKSSVVQVVSFKVGSSLQDSALVLVGSCLDRGGWERSHAFIQFPTLPSRRLQCFEDFTISAEIAAVQAVSQGWFADPTNPAVWKQQYLFNDQFYGVPGSLVFFYISGEDAIEGKWIQGTGTFISELAQANKAIPCGRLDDRQRQVFALGAGSSWPCHHPRLLYSGQESLVIQSKGCSSWQLSWFSRGVAQAQYSTRIAGSKLSQIQAAVESFLI
ncbi:hypothetical protein AeNC1_009266 [Aphanomyces euteiches]|nr:hypothetical protein AeNC1_009266 [Aphanomyces euteiches]